MSQKQPKYEASASVLCGVFQSTFPKPVSADSSTPSFLFYPFFFFFSLLIFNLYWVVWGSKASGECRLMLQTWRIAMEDVCHASLLFTPLILNWITSFGGWIIGGDAQPANFQLQLQTQMWHSLAGERHVLFGACWGSCDKHWDTEPVPRVLHVLHL